MAKAKPYAQKGYAWRVIADSGQNPEAKTIYLKRHGTQSAVIGEPARTIKTNERLRRAAATLSKQIQFR